MAEDEGEAGGPGDHADHGQPEVRHVLGGKPTVPDTELDISGYDDDNINDDDDDDDDDDDEAKSIITM